MRPLKSIEYCFEYVRLVLRNIIFFIRLRIHGVRQGSIFKKHLFIARPHIGHPDTFRQTILKLSKTTREFQVQPGGQEPELITKISGQPWWLQGVERPKCTHGHYMNFVVQILLSDIPGLNLPDNTLLSFHYCDTCTIEGRMPFGCEDKDNQGYDVSILYNIDKHKSDGRGLVVDQYGTSYKVTFREVNEIPESCEDMNIIDVDLPKDFPTKGRKNFDENVYPSLKHVYKSKIGGWPSWAQYPAWPCDENRKYDFIAQLDYMLFGYSAWAGGGYAYLFVTRQTDSKLKGEMVIQTT